MFWRLLISIDCHLTGCIGLVCPCFLFGKNAEFLGSGTWMGSCMTHFILWGLVNGLCCLLTDGILLGLPGSFVACYACGYRRALRTKYNLQVCNWPLSFHCCFGYPQSLWNRRPFSCFLALQFGSISFKLVLCFYFTRSLVLILATQSMWDHLQFRTFLAPKFWEHREYSWF